MTNITEGERLHRYRYISDTLSNLRDHRLSQERLGEIVSRHVYVPVTVGWVQDHWGLITREVHLNHPDLWVFRPQWQWGFLVGATTLTTYPKIALLQRYREMASRARMDLYDGNLRALARVDAEMASLVELNETVLQQSDEREQRFKVLLGELAVLPMATEAMIRNL